MTTGRTFRLAADSDGARAEWVAELRRRIEARTGIKALVCSVLVQRPRAGGRRAGPAEGCALALAADPDRIGVPVRACANGHQDAAGDGEGAAGEVRTRKTVNPAVNALEREGYLVKKGAKVKVRRAARGCADAWASWA